MIGTEQRPGCAKAGLDNWARNSFIILFCVDVVRDVAFVPKCMCDCICFTPTDGIQF